MFRNSIASYQNAYHLINIIQLAEPEPIKAITQSQVDKRIAYQKDSNGEE